MTASRSQQQIEQLLGSEPEHPLSTLQQHVAWENAAWRVECNHVHNAKTLEDRVAVRIAPAAEPIYSAVVVPLAADGRLHLVGRYRYAIGRWSIEFPRFAFDGGDDGWRAAADSDLFEMTGLAAEKMALLGAAHVDPEILATSAIVILAEGCRAAGRRKRGKGTAGTKADGGKSDEKWPNELGALRDDTGSLIAGSVNLSLAEMLKLVRAGSITCGPTLAALSLYRATLR